MELPPINVDYDIPDTISGINGKLPLYNVIVLNCDCHSQEIVMYAFQAMLGMPPHLAHEKMIAVHMLGQSIVATTHKEAAEHYKFLLERKAVNNNGHGLRVEIKEVS